MYRIDNPPPTISGQMHMGHVLSYCHMDFMARLHKEYFGGPISYPFCYDNNGIPTEILARKAGYYKKADILNYSTDVAVQYKKDLSSVGINFEDYEYHTSSSVAVEIATKAYYELLDRGIIYEAEADYLWCPKLETAVSKSEVNEEGIYERSGAKVEVRRGKAIFVRLLDYKKELITAVEAVKWHPEHFKKRLLDWIENLDSDWNISRQRKYGIQIPDTEFTFDTWFISSLSPAINFASESGYITTSPPIYDARFQGHDIIRTWTFYTIVLSYYLYKSVPWRNIYISGHCLDLKGRKMSKSLGNTKPISYYVNTYTSSGVRYWATHSSPGADIQIDEQLMLKGKKLTNKIRNASRYVNEIAQPGTKEEYNIVWKETEGKVVDALESANWNQAITTLDRFFWNTFCDIWIEDCKNNPCGTTLKSILDEVIDIYKIFLDLYE
jgi:valyl-tRNA synthetase